MRADLGLYVRIENDQTHKVDQGLKRDVIRVVVIDNGPLGPGFR